MPRHRTTYSAPIGNSLARALGPVDRLTRDEERTLGRLARAGDAAARDRMIVCNVPLAIQVASRFARRHPGRLDDLIGFACHGLIEGVDRWDPENGAKLGTYCYYWIDEGVRRGIQENFPLIHIPAHLMAVIGKDHTGTALTPRESQPGHKQRVKDARRVLLYASAGWRGVDDPFAETVDPNGEADDEGLGLPESVDSERLHAALGQLTEREALAVRLRFGLDGDEPLTLREIGPSLGVTKERVRQILVQAMDRLRKILTSSDHPTIRRKEAC